MPDRLPEAPCSQSSKPYKSSNSPQGLVAPKAPNLSWASRTPNTCRIDPKLKQHPSCSWQLGVLDSYPEGCIPKGSPEYTPYVALIFPLGTEVESYKFWGLGLP